MGNKIAVSYTH
ncbi:MAG: hypothetical protein RI915_1862, partial [Pseudomonadota bacterium]